MEPINTFFLIIYTLSLLFWLSGLLKAQDTLFIFPPVEVTASRPLNNFQSFSIIKQEDFEKVKALSLEESFSKLPGIIINDRNNPSLGDKISIRGIGARSSFGVRGIKILADNIPLTFPDGQSQTNNIDLYSGGKAEILKGPASAFYGNSAGGVINFESMLPSAGALNFSPQFIFGSFGYQKYSLRASGTIDSHSYLVSFNNLNYSGYRNHSARKSFLLNSVYENRLTGHLAVKAVLNYFDSPYLLNPGSLDKAASDKDRSSVRSFNKQQGTGEKSNQFQTGGTIYLADSGFTWETTLYFVKRNVLNPIPGRIIDLKRNSGGLRSFASKKLYEDKLQIGLNAGADIEFQNDLRKEFENNGFLDSDLKPTEVFKNLNYGSKLIDQKEKVFSAAPFISGELIVNKNLGLLSGVRYDSYIFKVDDPHTDNSGKRYMNKVSPFAGIFYNPGKNSKIYFNYSTSFQTPTASELSNRPDARGGFNPDLKPESIYQFELGSSFFIDALSTSVYTAGYYLNFSGLIIPYQLQNSEETYFRNAGKAGNRGFEIMIESGISENMKISFSYMLMDFEFRDYLVEAGNDLIQLSGNKVPGIPMQTFNLQLEYKNEEGLNGGINFYSSGKYFTNDFNGAPPGIISPIQNFINKDYLKIDLKLGYNLKLPVLSLKVFFGIDNLFDIKYNGSVVQNAAGERFFEPAPGRNWYSGVHVDI